jgi:23S rRNA pseudouridine2604 synthase
MRINKYLSECGVCSRREADILIGEGRVEVNGAAASFGMQISDGDEVKVNGQTVKPLLQKTYLVFNKPRGIVCTFEKREKDNLGNYLQLEKRVTYAGRLDKDSEGLLILTDDGDLIDALMMGSNGHEKEYVVETAQALGADNIKALSGGVYLKEINRRTLPCRVWQSGQREFHIVLTQGINRQIRRMCKNTGLRVVSLKRIRIENIKLGSLPSGSIREFTPSELDGLKKRTAGTKRSNVR